MERSVTSHHAWQEEPAPNIMWLLFKAPFAIFACVDGAKCVFLFCFLTPPHTHNEAQSKGHWRHTGKGVMGKWKTRQQLKIYNLLLVLEELFGPVNCSVCSLAPSLAVLAFAL